LIINPSDTNLAPPPPQPTPPSSNLSPTLAIPKEFSLFHKLLSLMTSLEEYSKRYASEFLFSLCGSDGLLQPDPPLVCLLISRSEEVCGGDGIRERRRSVADQESPLSSQPTCKGCHASQAELRAAVLGVELKISFVLVADLSIDRSTRGEGGRGAERDRDRERERQRERDRGRQTDRESGERDSERDRHGEGSLLWIRFLQVRLLQHHQRLTSPARPHIGMRGETAAIRSKVQELPSHHNQAKAISSIDTMSIPDHRINSNR
jgi:hypothetical protein